MRTFLIEKCRQGPRKSVFSCNALNLQSSAVFPTSFIHQEIFISIIAPTSFSLGVLFCARLVLVYRKIGRYFKKTSTKFLLECFVKMLRKKDSTEPFLDIKYLGIYSVRPGLVSFEKSLFEALFCLLFLRQNAL